jgi:FkbM family methyltransferase
VPYVFERLKRNYADVPRVRLANVAIAEQDGPVRFHHLTAPPDDLAAAGLPDWYDGIGSLSREHLLTHGRHFPDLENRLVATEVEGLTYASLLARHGLGHVDLLVIDTEGHDARIVRSIDFGDPPRLVVYEHFHLERAEREAAAGHLRAAGYELMEEGFDTFALQPAADALTQTWRRLRPAVAGVSAEDA